MQNETEVCLLFQERLARVLRCRLVSVMEAQGLLIEIWERPTGKLEVVVPSIAEDDLDAFLLNYRLLVQDNDRISIRRMSRVIQSLQVCVESMNEFEKVRDDLNAYLDAAPEVQLLGEPKTRRAFMDMLIYGSYAHLDPEKGLDAAFWVRVLRREHVDLLFCSMLKEVVSYLRRFETIVGSVLRQTQIG